MKGGVTPVHLQRWCPSDFQADPHVKLLLARRDWATLTFYRQFLDLSFSQGGELPADLELLAATVGMPIKTVEKALQFCVGRLIFKDGDYLYQGRVRREIQEELEYRIRQVEYGRRGGRPKGSRSPAKKEEKGTLRGAEGEPKGNQSPPAPAPAPAPAPIEPSPSGTSLSTRGESTHDPRREITWRIEQAWAMHLEARRRFFAEKNGERPSRDPSLTPEVREAIREQLHRHDAELLGADDRERWVRDSAVRAAGIGIFLDSWCTGRARDNRIGEDEGAKLFIEPWRPWKRLHRKPDPVPRYAELYWEAKDVQETGARKLIEANAAAQRSLQPASGKDLFGGLALPADKRS